MVAVTTRFDFHYLRAHVVQHRRALRPEHELRELDHADPLQWPRHRSLPPERALTLIRL